MTNQIELIEAKEQPVLSIRKRTTVNELKNELGKAFGAVMQFLAASGEQPAGPVFAAYYNMDMQNLDVEMGVLVSKPMTGKSEIKGNVIPAGKQVSCTYKGPYSQMEPEYAALSKWIAEKGVIPTGVSYEFYLNSPLEVPESDLLTRIMFPLK